MMLPKWYKIYWRPPNEFQLWDYFCYIRKLRREERELDKNNNNNNEICYGEFTFSCTYEVVYVSLDIQNVENV